MELWIRSQDKMELFNAKDIWIPNDADTSIWGQDGLRKTALGFYKSTKRALEVLDEIQKIINQNLMFHIDKSQCNTIEDIANPKFIIRDVNIPRVYEMPED